MTVRRIKPSGTVLIAAVALVIGLAAPAMAHQVNVAAQKISGGDLTPNSVTGKQIKESTLATVPRATVASKLTAPTWHKITHFSNGWADFPAGLDIRPAAYSVDAQGIVHLRGAITGGKSEHTAFTLPASVVSHSANLYIPIDTNDHYIGMLQIMAGDVTPTNAQGVGIDEAKTYTGLEGVSFAGH
jgi:hypothetical protein